MNSAIHTHVAALGWLNTPGRDTSGLHLALPTDLFMVTVHCAGLREAGSRQPALEMAVTLLRTRPEHFRSRAAGELAFALLTPAGLLALLRAPLDGVTDRRLALAQFCGPAELGALRDALLTQADPQLRMGLFGAWLESRIKQRHHFGIRQQRVAEAATLIQRHSGPIDLAALRRALHVSQRQMERDFRSWLGLSPALYARLVRFQRVALALAGGSALSAAAAEHGYADQSHMSSAVLQFSSLTPREFAQRSGRPALGAERRTLGGRVVVL